MTRVSIPIGAPREDVDERMMPEGVLRALTNARVRKTGGVESAPGWAATGPLEQSLTTTDGWTDGALAIADHLGSERIVGPDALFTRSADVLLGCGDLPALAAPRRVPVNGRDRIPLGVAIYGGVAYALSQDEDRFEDLGLNRLWITRFQKVGANWVQTSSVPFDPNESFAISREAACILPGTQYAYAGSNYGILERNMAVDTTPRVIGGTPTSFESIQALTDLNGEVFLLVESTSGQLDLYTGLDGTPTVHNLAHAELDDEAFGRSKWNACLGFTTNHTPALFVAFKSDYVIVDSDPVQHIWRLSAWNLASVITTGDAAHIGFTSVGSHEFLEWCKTIAIGPRLDQGTGIYFFRAGLPVRNNAVDGLRDSSIGAWTISDANTQSFIWDCARWKPYEYEVRFDHLEPVTGWSTEGDTSFLILCNYGAPLYDRGYVISASTSGQGGEIHVSARVESVFAPGEVHRRHTYLADFPTWYRNEYHGQLCCTDAAGSLLAQIPISDGDYSSSDLPKETALFSWSLASEELDSDPVGSSVSVSGLSLFTGGMVSGYSGDSTFDMGISAGIPGFESLAADGSGTMSGAYQYAVVWEWIDPVGAHHLSAPSKAYRVNPASAESVRMQLKRRSMPSGARGVVAHVYRTTDAGLTFYELRPYHMEGANIVYGPPGVEPGSPGEVLFDSEDDADILERPILYTQGATGALGGQLPYAPPPACRSLAVSPTRVLCGGLENVRTVHWSHEFFPGEPPVWSDFDGCKMTFPDEVIAVAWCGSQWLMFSADRVLAVSGQGPDVSGNGEWSVPYEVASPTGAHSPLGVTSTSFGTLFQGSDGQIYLVPFGAMSASLVSQPIQTSLSESAVAGDWVVSIVELERGGVIVAVVQTRLKRFVYDTQHQLWTEETLDMLGRAASVGGELRWVGTYDGDPWIGYDDEPGERPSWGAEQRVIIDFGRIYPFGQDGYGRVRKVIPLLSASSEAQVTFEDLDENRTASFFVPEVGDFDNSNPGEWSGVEWALARQKRESLLFRIDAAGYAAWRFHALAVDFEPIQGGNRRGARIVASFTGANPDGVFVAAFDETFE